MRFNTFRGGQVYVLSEKCDTCVFRRGNLMDLGPKRLRNMVAESVRHGTTIPCHQTLSYYHGPAAGKNAICAGFWESCREEIWILRLAIAMNRITMTTIEELEREGGP